MFKLNIAKPAVVAKPVEPAKSSGISINIAKREIITEAGGLRNIAKAAAIQEHAKPAIINKPLTGFKLPTTHQTSMLAKALINGTPDKVLEKVEKAIDSQVNKPQPVNAIKLSLKDLIAVQKQVEEEKQNAPIEGEIITPKKLDDDPYQDAAVEGIVKNQFACLIGSAGTGKTTTVLRAVEALADHIEMLEWEEEAKNGFKTKHYKPSICFCSFTGRAVEQLKKRLPEKYHASCGTIHGDKCLTYIPEFYDDIMPDGTLKSTVQFLPTFDAQNKMPYNIYFMDESGMTAIDLWDKFIAAVKPDARIYLIGDINQLPPVYGKSVLGYAMGKWPTFELKTIHRQAADNPIISNAHRILNGLIPFKVPEKFDLVDVGSEGSSGTQTKFINVIKQLNRTGHFDCMKDGAIVAYNKQTLGQLTMNELLTPYFNPTTGPHNKRTMIKTGMALTAFAVGDKVMMLSNDKENNLTNGQIGQVISINPNGSYKDIGDGMSAHAMGSMSSVELDADNLSLDMGGDDFELTDFVDKKEEKEDKNQRQASHVVTVRFGELMLEEGLQEEYTQQQLMLSELNVEYNKATQRAAKSSIKDRIELVKKQINRILKDSGSTAVEVPFSTAGEFRRLAHAYCITCHKSQGGEYPTVVVLVHSACATLLSREWLYTAVTRAQNRVVLVFNQRGLLQALKNQRIKGNTLAEKIKSFMDESSASVADDGPFGKSKQLVYVNLPEPKELK